MGRDQLQGDLPEIDSRALEIVEKCLGLDEAERERCVAQSCAGAPRLREKVERMLAMDRTQFRLLPTEALTTPEAPHDPIPDRIAAYRIVGVIERGGMGTVLRGERDDGVYRQTVAIKLIRADLKDARARERFALERRILARLTHPGIARILDGGTADGQPYLIMEFVDGCPVTEELQVRGADINERLARFESICEAVSHAHRNLVVHADIKPSNVIATDDGSIKLLDFGVSRLTAELDEHEVEGPYPLTRGYAAPERLAGQPPTVSSDVYSLGALLHEMLTGRRPDPAEGPRDGIGSETRQQLAADPPRDDISAIVAKALAADPSARYSDVGELLADLRLYQERRPVRARNPTWRYRTRLFLLRNRLPLALGGAVFLLLAAATAISLFLYFDARRQRAAAEARFEEVRSLAKFQLFDLYDELAEVPGTTAARAQMADQAQRYLDRLAAVPSAPPEVRLELAAGLNRLASVLGVPKIPNLGRPQAARDNLVRASGLLDGLRAEAPADPDIALEIARNRIWRARMAIWIDFRTDRARPLLAEARREIERGGARTERGRDLEALRRSALLDLLGWEEKYAEARAAADGTIAWLNAWPREPRPLLHALTLADALNARGDARYYLADAPGALDDYRRAERLLAEAALRWPRNAAVLARRMVSGYNVVTTLDGLGRASEMAPLAMALVEQGERLIALEASDETLRRRQQLNRELAAQALAAVGRYDEAVAQQSRLVEERAAAQRSGTGEPQPLRDLAFSRSVLGTLLWSQGRRDQACGQWASASSAFERLGRSRQLNEYDRAHSAAYVRRNVEICSGARPASDYRAPE